MGIGLMNTRYLDGCESLEELVFLERPVDFFVRVGTSSSLVDYLFEIYSFQANFLKDIAIFVRDVEISSQKLVRSG